MKELFFVDLSDQSEEFLCFAYSIFKCMQVCHVLWDSHLSGPGLDFCPVLVLSQSQYTLVLVMS